MLTVSVRTSSTCVDCFSEDLEYMCRQLNMDDAVEEIMQQLGADEHGYISFEEFSQCRMRLRHEIELEKHRDCEDIIGEWPSILLLCMVSMLLSHARVVSIKSCSSMSRSTLMHIRMHARTHARTHTHTHACTHTHTHRAVVFKKLLDHEENSFRKKFKEENMQGWGQLNFPN